MSLSDVESLSHLLTAQTQLQRKLALSASGIGPAFRGISVKITELRAKIEAGIDFSDDVDFDHSSLRKGIRSVINDLKSVGRGVSRGTLIMNGLRIVLIGRTNVGKSSLINRLAQREVAIVSKIEGTTRDSLEARIEIASIPILLTDTAGIRISNDPIESEGVNRALSRIPDSHLVLLVIDASCKDPTAEITSLLDDCNLKADDRIIIVLNKSDLIDDQPQYSFQCEQVYTSCVGDVNLETLISVIEKKIREMCPSEECNALLSRANQRMLLSETIKWLEMFEETDDLSIAAEILRKVHDYIGEISGTVVNEDILDNIFSSFCIGK